MPTGYFVFVTLYPPCYLTLNLMMILRFCLCPLVVSVLRLRCSFVGVVEKGNEIFVWSKSYHFIKKRRQSTHSHIKTQLASTCGISRNESDWRNHVKFIGRSTLAHAHVHTERQTHGKWFTWVWVSQTTGDRGVFGRRRASCVGLVNWPKLSAPERERERELRIVVGMS